MHLYTESAVDGRICPSKQKAASVNSNHLTPVTEAEQFKYFFLPADFPVQLTENIVTEKEKKKFEAFMKVKAPFAGHPAASSAWPPAATPSLLGGLESHCNKEKQ